MPLTERASWRPRDRGDSSVHGVRYADVYRPDLGHRPDNVANRHESPQYYNGNNNYDTGQDYDGQYYDGPYQQPYTSGSLELNVNGSYSF